MTEQKYTPGPWTATIGIRGAHINVGNDYNHPLSFGFRCSEFNAGLVKQMQANACLIAAAPHLLEACKAYLDSANEADDMVADEMIRAAVELATNRKEL